MALVIGIDLQINNGLKYDPWILALQYQIKGILLHVIIHVYNQNWCSSSFYIFIAVDFSALGAE